MDIPTPWNNEARRQVIDGVVHADLQELRVVTIAERFSNGPDAASARQVNAQHEPGAIGLHSRRFVEKQENSLVDAAARDVALHTLMNNFEQGLVVANKSGRACFLNRAAHVLIRKGLLQLECGCLRSSTLGDTMVLLKLIARCAVGRTGGSMRLVSEHGTLLVTVCAVPADACQTASGAVLLRLVDPASARLPNKDVLRDQFGFTAAEAALAADLLAGHDLAASAMRREVTLNTVRAHLRSIFSKTGTRRQAELMRLLLLCPQPIAAE